MTINSAFLLGKISRMDSLICRRRLTDLQTNPEHFLFHETKFGLHNLAAGISQTQIVLSAMTGRVTCLLFRLFLTNLAGFFSRQPGRILGQNPGFFSKSCPKNKSCRPAGPRSPGVRNSCRDILVIPAGKIPAGLPGKIVLQIHKERHNIIHMHVHTSTAHVTRDRVMHVSPAG